MSCIHCNGKLVTKLYQSSTKIAGFKVTDSFLASVCEDCSKPELNEVQMLDRERRAVIAFIKDRPKLVSGEVLSFVRRVLTNSVETISARLKISTNEYASLVQSALLPLEITQALLCLLGPTTPEVTSVAA